MTCKTDNEPIFNCVKCGECCKGFGGTYVTDENIKAIAAYTNRTEEDIRKNCLAPSGSRFVIKQNAEGYCVFFRDKLCSIHPVKPAMCRKWPYLNSILIDFSNWKAMGASCKGINVDADQEKVRDTISESIRNNMPPMD